MKITNILVCVFFFGCTQYSSPQHDTWDYYLSGASFIDMTETAKTAKKPVYMGHGGKVLNETVNINKKMEYGDKSANDTNVSREYMARLEYELYNSLRTPGVSVERAGTDVVIVLVRDAIIAQNIGDISDNGTKILQTIAYLLRKYDSTYLEIAGYTDSMRDSTVAKRMSLDMAERTGVFLSHKKINPVRMFIVGRGAARPIAAQDGIGRLTNRRIEIRLSPVR